MSKKRILQMVVAVCLLGLLWLRSVTTQDPLSVTVALVERGQVERTVANTRAGAVKACRRAKLSPSIGGQIASLPVHEGDRVQVGALLLELWNDDLTAQAALSESEVVAARAAAEAACFNADEAKREADRLGRLWHTRAISDEQVEQAATKAKARQAECDSAQAQVEVSKGKTGVAKANLARTRLHAPFTGVVAEINGELNEYVTPSPPGIPTLPVVDLVDDSCFYVAAPIDEMDAQGIVVGMQARISMDAFGNKSLEAKVRRIADYVLDKEKQARTVEVEADFSDPALVSGLLAGFSADLEIVLQRREGVLRIPTEAVMEGGKVLVLTERGQLQERKLTIGLSNWKYSEVVQGLTEGEQVVKSTDQTGLKAGISAKAVTGEAHDPSGRG